jgi:gamma-glutamyl-gamma-aminobutyrate hydrolase PuuD
MSARVVAVTQREDAIVDRAERRDALDQRLAAWLSSAGFVPVPVPNSLGAAVDAWLITVNPDAFVFSGGNDIGEAPSRDATERRLLDHARDRQRPVLGICRGMQMMSVWAGGQLARIEGHVRTRHQFASGGQQWPREVNSFHNFGLVSCPPGFTVALRAADGSIEAIRHETLPWEGWMWHPEREEPVSSIDTTRLRDLFDV